MYIELRSGDFVVDPTEAYKRPGLCHRDWQIVWLNYTRPGRIGTHINKFTKPLASRVHGDIIRLTLDTNEKAFRNGIPKDSVAQKQRDRFD